MASSKFEFILLIGNLQQMNVSRSILIERHRLQENVVSVGGRCDFVDQINNLVDNWADLESVWVHLFADLAFEPFPVE